MTTAMPTIDLEQIPEAHKAMAQRIMNGDKLRATKPPVDKGNIDTAKAAYVWRMVAFYISPKRAHQCMPVLADWDIPGTYTEVRAITDELDKTVDAIYDTIPKDQRHGVRRWGMALGMIGTPQTNETGAIVYR